MSFNPRCSINERLLIRDVVSRIIARNDCFRRTRARARPHATMQLRSQIGKRALHAHAPVITWCDQYVNYTDQGMLRVGCILGNWELAGIVALPLHRRHASAIVRERKIGGQREREREYKHTREFLPSSSKSV